MNEHDWRLLNAYVDGELGPDEAASFSARLGRDPALSIEFDRIRRLKTRLEGLREPGRRPVKAAMRSFAPLAAAASLLVAAMIGSVSTDGPEENTQTSAAISVLDIHSELAALAVPELEAANLAEAAGQVPPPDLGASRLSLFAVRQSAPERTIGYHYRGANGCRVTLLVGPSLDLPKVTLARQWSLGEETAVLVADGMDPRRFEAVAAYAEAAMRGPEPAESMRLVLVESTVESRPCA